MYAHPDEANTSMLESGELRVAPPMPLLHRRRIAVMLVATFALLGLLVGTCGFVPIAPKPVVGDGKPNDQQKWSIAIPGMDSLIKLKDQAATAAANKVNAARDALSEALKSKGAKAADADIKAELIKLRAAKADYMKQIKEQAKAHQVELEEKIKEMEAKQATDLADLQEKLGSAKLKAVAASGGDAAAQDAAKVAADEADALQKKINADAALKQAAQKAVKAEKNAEELAEEAWKAQMADQGDAPPETLKLIQEAAGKAEAAALAAKQVSKAEVEEEPPAGEGHVPR